MNTRTLAFAVLSAAMLAGGTMPAAAADAEKGRASVSYSDLDLSTEAGRAELAKRFDQAARDMCGIADATEKLHGKERYCYENNSKQLKTRVAAILSEHDGKSGKGAVAVR
jgi:UrcA family protein